MTRCDYCGRDRDGSDRWGGPDPCLGRLPGVLSACCGHGSKPPYVWLTEGPTELVNRRALEKLRELGGDPPAVGVFGPERVPRLLSAVSVSRT